MDASYREPLSTAAPIGYAVLSVPPKAEMRRKGYDPQHIAFNGLEAHPLATWKTFGLPAGSTYKDAVTALQGANSKPWGLVKARIQFSDGSMEMYERTNPSVPSSFANIKTYDPNDVFRTETMGRSAVNKAKLEPRLKPLVDERGHYTGGKTLPRSFAPENLYKNCPPPVHSQAGYDFTPISHSSFLVKPHDHPEGVRDVQSNFMHSSTDYRPRSYLRGPAQSRHCHCAEVYQVGDYTMDLARQTDVVNHRNRTTVKEFTASGTCKANSTIVGRRHAQEPAFAGSSAGVGGTSADMVVGDETVL